MALVPVDWRPTPRKVREFAVALAVFGVLLAGWLRWRHDAAWGTVALVAGGAALLASLGLVLPPLLRPLYVGLMVLTWPIGVVVSWTLMAVVYYGVVTPIGCLRRWIGGDPLKRRFDPSATTYWEPHRDADRSRYFRQY